MDMYEAEERRKRRPAANAWRTRSAADLEAEFDPRLADVWLSVFESWPENAERPEQLGWFLRMAYLQGYGDALSEPQRGALFRNLGLLPAGSASPSLRWGREEKKS